MSFSSMESLNPHDRDPEDDVPDDRKVNKRTNSKGSKIEPGPGLAAEGGGGAAYVFNGNVPRDK